MAEIALPTYQQVDDILNNQPQTMSLHFDSGYIFSSSYNDPTTILDISGAGVLLFIAKNLNNAVIARVSIRVDGQSNDSPLVIGNTTAITYMVPFQTSLKVDGYYEGAEGTQLEIAYLLK